MDKFSLFLIRRQLTLLAHSIRKSHIPANANLSLPQSVKDDYILFENKLLRRKRVVLLAPACSVATCTMCPLPNEALDKKRAISPYDLIKQFGGSFNNVPIDSYGMITVYNNGNFFSDHEIPPLVRQYIYKKIGESQALYFVVESLPQFINNEKISEAKKLLGEKQLVVTIGFQSSNDLVRELAINTTCSKKIFEEAVKLLKGNNYIPLAYLMIKPPFLTEKEAINDTIDSIDYLSKLGINNPILCATKVAPNTIADLLFRDGYYNPPWLWTVLEILKESKKINPDNKPRVNTSEIIKDKNKDSICAQNCTKCTDSTIEKIGVYNKTYDVSVFNKNNCRCYRHYQKFLEEEERKFGSIPLQERIAQFLQNHKIN